MELLVTFFPPAVAVHGVKESSEQRSNFEEKLGLDEPSSMWREGGGRNEKKRL